MIRYKISAEQGPRLELVQVVARYEIDGAPRLDLIDARGQLLEAAEVLGLGGRDTQTSALPEVGAEGVALTTPNGAPYILGALTTQRRAPQATLSEAGEYDTTAPALQDVSMSAGEAALIVSAQEGALYMSPRARVQGALEVSSGAAPQQSAAIGELTLEALEAHQATLEALVSAVAQLQTLAAQAWPLTFDAQAAAKTTEAATLAQAGDVAGAARATAEAAQAAANAAEARTLAPSTLTPPAPPSRDIISELIKTER